MDYYKLFFDLSDQYGCLDFSFPTNYEDYELLKIEYDPIVEFDSPIKFDVDFDAGEDELDLSLSQGGSVIVSHRFKDVYEEKDFGRRVGTKGETKLRVVVDPIKNKIVTSFHQGEFILP